MQHLAASQLQAQADEGGLVRMSLQDDGMA